MMRRPLCGDLSSAALARLIARIQRCRTESAGPEALVVPLPPVRTFGRRIV